MTQSNEMDTLDTLGEACNNFSSILRTIRLFDAYMDSSDHSIPPEEIEDKRNAVKAPLAILLTYMQGGIENTLEDLYEERK